MTGAVLLVVAVMMSAAAAEFLIAEWRALMRTFRGWPVRLDPARGQSSTALVLSTDENQPRHR